MIDRRHVLLSAAALGVAGCSHASSGSTAAEGGRSAAAQRIISTSVTITGSLLGAGIPVLGSGTAAVSDLTDANGWFSQWADVAVERGVEPLYSLDVDLERIAAAAPDLIVGSANGGDSAADVLDQLSAIAPTTLFRYDDTTWQELTTELGAATGHEAGAAAAVAQFAAELQDAAGRLTVPAGPVAALVHNGAGEASRFWTPESAQGSLLAEAGFTLLEVPDGMGTIQDGRADVVDVTAENLAPALAGAVAVVLFSGDETSVAEFSSARTISTLPAVAGGRVFAAGLDSFRLDAYSAANVLDRLVTSFG